VNAKPNADLNPNLNARVPWWQSAVVYQIYPRSFADSTGSGVGDLPGVTSRLDYLAWLGVDAIWLSPFYPSPMADFGYDASDYCDVDPLFGSLEDFDALVAAAHARGIRVIIDWVPAHTSDQHPWFREARSSRDHPRRDWYIWRDPAAGGAPPNNWSGSFTSGPAWTYDRATEQYYLHSFLPEQPDLNWANPEVVEAMHGVLRFWLDRGVDGFRADVVHNIGKDPALPDLPAERAPVPHHIFNDVPQTHAHLRQIRRLLDAYPGERMMVGEVVLFSVETLARYYGAGDELHLAFNFPAIFAPWEAAPWAELLDAVARAFVPVGAWPTWVLSNHDVKRHRTRYGSMARARSAAVLLLTLRGTPFLYSGEELGLRDAEVPEERTVDPGGRDGCRAPIPWDPTPGHGWGPEPWLPWPPEAAERNVQTLRAREDSVLHLYRRLIGLRRSSPALRHGDQRPLAAPDGVLAYRREAEGEARVVLVNLSDEPRRCPLDGASEVTLSSAGARSGRFDGALGPDEALVLRPLG
jgi:alpha-glucosidase